MECGECTECCELFHVDSKKATGGNIIEAIIIDSPAGELCGYCEKNVGCKVHEERPKICRDFFCAYAQHEKAPVDLRPDVCGIIFEKLDEDLFLGTVRPNKIVSDYGLEQIKAFNKQGYNVVLSKHTTPVPRISCAEGADEFKVLEKFLKIRREANGKYTDY